MNGVVCWVVRLLEGSESGCADKMIAAAGGRREVWEERTGYEVSWGS
jgi:hypothetical protein